MKIKLKNNHEVGHYWANQVQDSGRGSNLFFEGNTIYSYGYHFLIAKHIKPGIVLFNANSYSQSTAKHKSIVRGAIPHGTTVLTVPDIDINGRRGAWDQRAHKNNIKYLLNKIRKYLLKAGRARKYGEYYTKQALGYFRMMDKYLSIFKCKSNLPYKIKKEIKYFAGCNWISIQSEIKEADSIKRKRRKKEALEKLAAWRDGEINTLPRTSRQYLRYTGNGEIETSLRSTISVEMFLKYYTRLASGENLTGEMVDHWTVTNQDNKLLTIGCHKIEFSEIKAMAEFLEKIANQ